MKKRIENEQPLIWLNGLAKKGGSSKLECVFLKIFPISFAESED
jgi:hypothetical protein